jgi:PPOX class probable F420-dependent enzyme
VIFDAQTPAGARALERLRDPQTMTIWLTTVTPEGQPQSMPVWFVWLEDEILVYGDHRARRNANLEANPRVNLHLREDEGGGDVVVIDGTARIDPAYPECGDQPAYMAKYGALIDKYYGGPAAFGQTYSMPIRITPTKGRASLG